MRYASCPIVRDAWRGVAPSGGTNPMSCRRSSSDCHSASTRSASSRAAARARRRDSQAPNGTIAAMSRASSTTRIVVTCWVTNRTAPVPVVPVVVPVWSAGHVARRTGRGGGRRRRRASVVGLALEEDPPPSGTRLYSGATPLRVPGVGSKRTQPSRGKYSSGQAWASDGAHDPVVAVDGAGQEPDRHPGRDAGGPREHDHGRGELHAVAALGLQEAGQRLVGQVPVGGLVGQLEGVGELSGRAGRPGPCGRSGAPSRRRR